MNFIDKFVAMSRRQFETSEGTASYVCAIIIFAGLLAYGCYLTVRYFKYLDLKAELQSKRDDRKIKNRESKLIESFVKLDDYRVRTINEKDDYILKLERDNELMKSILESSKIPVDGLLVTILPDKKEMN